MKYTVTSLKERFDLFNQQEAICDAVWPEFMLHDPVADEYWMEFIEAYKEYQLLIMQDDKIVAIMTTVPIFFDKPIEELPDEGWDWGVKRAIENLRNGIKPNMLMGLQIVVNKKHQGKGISSIAVKEMVAHAKRMSLDKLIIAVRPSEKHKYPLQDIKSYIKWKNDKDLPFDNWLRVHIKTGGEIVRICPKAMYIPGTIKQWEEWTGLRFKESGLHIVPGALNPVMVNLEEDNISYVEPNVWVLHKIK